MNREGKKCVLYPRVSTEMQVDGYSLEGQKNGLKRFADREEMEIVGIYEDAGKSGKSIEGRPAFKKMLSDIKNGLEIDYILVYKLSRFGRNAADILNSLEFVQSYGINLICIEEGIDSSQTSGKLLISVLSAVAEIERENIIEQTMNGRREKARQGGWNGGFAPYGYYLKDNQLLIEETEAEAIRIIFDKFANSDIGLGGVAKYLNLQGIKKIPRQNGTLETWSSHFIRLILDNPVYCGKIAYGRRTREKVKGTKNEYKQVHAEDYILEDGQHEGIISEELWQKVHAKRMATGIKQPSKIGKDRSHLLTGILKCPLCGSSMYTNKHAWTNKDGTYKEVYYYICGRNKQERGHHCDYKASLRKTDIEPLVIEAVKELVSDKYFAKEIEKRIGVQTDTTAIDKELANYESKLKEVDLNKARLEREIDNLPVDTRFRERKIHDMTLRLDALYDTIVELEERIEDAKLRKSSIEMETITLDNIYKLMLNFGKLYDIISDEEKKSLITYLIKEIQIYPNGESEQPLKSIEFNFPIYRDGQEVRRLLWEKGNTVEMEELLQKICRGAAYQFETQVENGYIPLPGGHRAGICGTFVKDEKGMVRIRDLASVNFRICRDVSGIAEDLFPKLLCDGKFCSTLIVSEPCGGKTTLLTDLVRTLSKNGYRSAVIDERGEIAAVFRGVPQKDLGELADVLDGYPKPYGMMIALRTLSPQVLVCDEIGSREETEKMLEAMNAGVPVLATAHARDEEELFNRPQIKRLTDAGAISKIVLLKGAKTPGKIRKVMTVNHYDDEDFWSSTDC